MHLPGVHNMQTERWLVRVWGSPYNNFEYVVEGSYGLAMKTTDRYPSGFICDAIPLLTLSN